jgi:two-component system sensor histidine kinase TctE
MSALLLTLTIVVWFGVQLGLRPLADLQDAIERRSPDDLSRIQRRVPTEVTGIVATLNKLFGQVDDSIQAHQTFISDAAHQLRNPASALLSIAETLPQVTDPVERKKQEAALLSAARKSATLAEQLLSLERLRYSAPKNTQRVDLNEVVQGMCTDLAPKVLSRDIAFQFDPTTAALPADADAVLIGEAVRNLVNNALAHGGPDLSSITVSTARVGPTALIRVIDDGIGIPPEDAKHAFRRFAQLSSNDGSGLGLSIVQAVAQSHFGTASLETVAKGTSVCITLPVAK